MMIDTKYKAIGFDMDGTLIHSFIDYDLLGSVVPDTLIELGVPNNCLNRHTTDKEMIEKSIDYLSKNGLTYTFKDIVSLISKRTVDVELMNIEKANLFPGTIEMLKELRNRGYAIGLLSNGHREYVEAAMNKFGIKNYLDAIVAYDDHHYSEGKPNPLAMKHLSDLLGMKPEDILFLGDSIVDFECARDSGSGFVAVSSGKNGKERWNNISKEIIVIDNVASLLL